MSIPGPMADPASGNMQAIVMGSPVRNGEACWDQVVLQFNHLVTTASPILTEHPLLLWE